MVASTLRARTRLGVVHVHSTYSRDGRDTLDALREFALARGLAFVGLTDHAEDMQAATYARYVEECAGLSDDGVQLIPGLEFRFAGFTGLHLLALGLDRWISPATPDEFIAQTKGGAAFTIVAHPVLAAYRVPPAVATGIDAIEIWNASYNTRYLPDPRAIGLLHMIRRTRSAIVGTAGLDQHDCQNDRETRIELHRSDGDAMAELKAGRFSNVGRTIRLDAAASMTAVQFGALSVARAVLDGIEHVHERWARALAAGAAR